MSSRFNQKILAEFDSLKDDDETFHWIGKPQLSSFVSGMLATGLIGLAFWAGMIAINRYIPSSEDISFKWVLIVVGFIVIPEAFRFIRDIFRYPNTLYGYSNKRIMMRSGFIGTDLKMINFDKIIEITVKVNPIDRMYRTGTIKFYSGKENEDSEGIVKKEYDEWSNIENPYVVLKALKKVMSEVKSKNN